MNKKEIQLEDGPSCYKGAEVHEWWNIFSKENRPKLEKVIPDYLLTCRWFGGKARTIQSAKVTEAVPLLAGRFYITLVQVDYVDGNPEVYNLPLAFVQKELEACVLENSPQAVVATLKAQEEGILYDALNDKVFCKEIIRAVAHQKSFNGEAGKIAVSRIKAFRKLAETLPEPELLKEDTSNTTVVYGDRLILKFIRRLEEGKNPELEIGRFLAQKSFAHIPPLCGALEYFKPESEITLAILHGYVPNQGSAWHYTQDALAIYYERALIKRTEVKEVPTPEKTFIELIDDELPVLAQEMIGSYVEDAQLLGERTAELHLALASGQEDPDFAPEAFSMLYQRSIYYSMQSLGKQVFQLLRSRLKDLPEATKHEAQQVLDLENEVQKRFNAILDYRITAMRIRCHGDYHLAQILRTGNDFVIIDFEGEPARALSERKIKRSPFRDIAGLIRSFHYAAYTLLLNKAIIRQEDVPLLEKWADFWHTYAGVIFLKSYLNKSRGAIFVPEDKEEIKVLLNVFLLEKAVYELGYELNNRPDWVLIPLKGIKQLLEV